MELRHAPFPTKLRKTLTESEKVEAGGDAETWIALRDLIISLWLENPITSLSWEEVKPKLGKWAAHEDKAKVVYKFLVQRSHINMGICTPLAQKIKEGEPFKVVVVGGGVSGLSTARHLRNIWRTLSHRPIQITILEASERIGGRVCSIPLTTYPNVAVDLGAQMVTGFEDGNPLDIIVRRQLGIHSQYLLQDCPLIDVNNGREISKEADQHAETIFNELLERAAEMGEVHKTEGEDASLGQTLSMLLTLHRDYSNLTNAELRAVQWHIANLEFANGALIDDLSLVHWDQDDENEFRGPHAILKGGFGQVPHALAFVATGQSVEDTLNCKGELGIHLNTPVTEIKYGEHCVVKSGEKTFEANVVVLSTSLGVLKSDKISFEPKLPDWKRDTIKRMGFGFFNKVILVFNKPFWPTTVESFGSLPNVGAQWSAESFDFTKYSKVRGQCYLFWNLIPSTGVPALVAFVSGECAREWESHTDDQVVREALQTLAKMFHHTAGSTLMEAIVTRWSRDENIGGSYSYVAKGSTGEDYDLLSKPIENLYFAGEATNRNYPATVHGALLSGIRAAHEIVSKHLTQ